MDDDLAIVAAVLSVVIIVAARCGSRGHDGALHEVPGAPISAGASSTSTTSSAPSGPAPATDRDARSYDRGRGGRLEPRMELDSR